MIRLAIAVVGAVGAFISASLVLGGATIAGAPLSALIVSFAVYGFIGWAYEPTVCAMLSYGHFANSGFLLGPCCPIYGVGGVACWLMLRGIEHPVAQFVAAAVVCCAIEYVVGYALEQVTHARFWDYSKFPLNLHGRICLYGALVFGTASLLVCRVTEPALLALMGMLPSWVVMLLALAIVCCLAVDTFMSLASWKRLSAQLESLRGEMADRINEGLRDASDSMLEHVPASAVDSAQSIHTRGQAINGWLVTLSDAAMSALRGHVAMPAFVEDGREGLKLAVQRLKEAAPSMPSMPKPGTALDRGSRKAARRPARPVPSLRLRRRDLRYFNAFPNLRMLPYEGIIRATGLKDRARELFRRR